MGFRRGPSSATGVLGWERVMISGSAAIRIRHLYNDHFHLRKRYGDENLRRPDDAQPVRDVRDPQNSERPRFGGSHDQLLLLVR